MSIIYKQMQKEHLKAVSQIEKECFSRPWSEAAFYDELENPLSLTVVAIYTDSSKEQTVAGFVNVRIIGNEVYINNIAVSENFRRKGIGKGLLTSLEKIAESKNAAFITLEVRESNSPAVSLYASLGYLTAGKRKKFYRDPIEDALLMTKNLI